MTADASASSSPNTFSMCGLTTTRTWPMSMKAIVCSSWYTTLAGICPATILQNTQLSILTSARDRARSSHPRKIRCRRAGYLEHAAILEPHGGQRPAPYAGRIQREQVSGEPQAERGPVAAHDRDAARFPPWALDPRQVARRRLLELALDAELHDSLGGAEAHPGHRVHDDAQPIHAAQVVPPGIGPAAVKLGEEEAIPLRAELGLDLRGEILRLRDRPGGQQSGVHHHVFSLDVQHRAKPEPIEEELAIGGREHVFERVVGAPLSVPGGVRQQVEVVVSLNDHRAVAEPLDEANDRERLRS